MELETISLFEIIRGLQQSQFDPGETINGDKFRIVVFSQDCFQLVFDQQPPKTWVRVNHLQA